MKKGLRIFAIVLAVVLLILIIIPITLESKVGDIVKKEASSMLKAKLDFEDLGISLFRHFPNASLDLNKLSIVGVEPFEGDTLVYSDRISVVVNLFSLFGDSFEVTKLILDRPMVQGLVNKDGGVNWDIMIADSKEEVVKDTIASSEQSSNFKLQIKDFRINNGRVIFIDEVSAMQFYSQDLNLKLRGDLGAEQTDLKINLSSEETYYVMGKTLMLNKANAMIDAEVLADLKNSKFTFKNNNIKLNNIELSLDGYVAMVDDAIDVDIKANSSKVQFKDILSMVPAFYLNDFKNLSASGDMSLDIWAKGRLEGNNTPAFNAKLSVNNGSFKYSSLPQSVDNINVVAAVYSDGGDIDNTIVDVSNLSLTFAKNPFKASFYAKTPISDMYFKITANGKLDLGSIKEVYPLGDSVSLSGIVGLNVDVASKISDIDKQQYQNIKASGEITIDNMVANLKDMPQIDIVTMKSTVSPSQISLSALDVKIGNSDISAHGSLTNCLAYVLNGDKLSGSLTVKSKLLDVNQLLGNTSAAPTATVSDTTNSADSTIVEAFEIPMNLNLSLNSSIDKILFQKIVITNFVGDIFVNQGVAKLSRLNMNAFGGVLSSSGSYNTAEGKHSSALNLSLDFSKAQFSETFKQLEVVKDIVPIFEKTGGDYSMKMEFSTTLDSKMSPELNTINAKGVIQSSSIDIQNIKAFEALAVALKDDRIKNISAKDVKISFTIKDGKIITTPFDLKMGNINMNLSGITSLDQSIDYNLKVTLPKSTTGGYINTIPAHIGGTFSSPKITLDVESVVKDVVKSTISKELLGGKDFDEEIKARSEKLMNDAKAAGDKLIEAAKNEAQKLVEKTTNPIAKIAAKKGAELVVKKAEEQAQKLIESAQQEIAELNKNKNK